MMRVKECMSTKNETKRAKREKRKLSECSTLCNPTLLNRTDDTARHDERRQSDWTRERGEHSRKVTACLQQVNKRIRNEQRERVKQPFSLYTFSLSTNETTSK